MARVTLENIKDATSCHPESSTTEVFHLPSIGNGIMSRPSSVSHFTLAPTVTADTTDGLSPDLLGKHIILTLSTLWITTSEALRSLILKLPPHLVTLESMESFHIRPTAISLRGMRKYLLSLSITSSLLSLYVSIIATTILFLIDSPSHKQHISLFLNLQWNQ
ncbi:MAG: hypothetical protein J3R72DRAFT_518942, partial [Linnemannia gamsii]